MARLIMQRWPPWCDPEAWIEFDIAREDAHGPVLTTENIQSRWTEFCRNNRPSDDFTTELFGYLLRRLGIPDAHAVNPRVARERCWFVGEIRPLPQLRAIKNEVSAIMLHGYVANALYQFGNSVLIDCDFDQMHHLSWKFSHHYWTFIQKGETFLQNMGINLMMMASYTPFWSEIPWSTYNVVDLM